METEKPGMLKSYRWKAILAGLVLVVLTYLAKELLGVDAETANQIAVAICTLIGLYVGGRTVTDMKSNK